LAKPNKLEQKPDIQLVSKIDVQNKEIATDESVTPLHDVGNGYVEFNKGLYKQEALKELRPDLFSAKFDLYDNNQSSSSFGTQFPKISKKGNIFVRVDVNPNRVFKFDGQKWIEVSKEVTQTYLSDLDYLEFLVNKIGSGEYDIDSLTETERLEVEAHLKGNRNS
jgi:hypothetical protein